MLTTVRDRDLVLGLLYADFRESMWALTGPTALVMIVFAIGAGSPTLAVVGTLAALVLVVASLLVGYVLGLGLRTGIERLGLSSVVRSLLGAFSGVGVVLLFAAGGALVGAAGADITDASSFASMAPEGPPPIPFGYYADFFFLGTPLLEGVTTWALVSGAVVLATIPACLWSIVILTPRLWYTDPPASGTVETDDETASPETTVDGRRRDLLWLSVPSGVIADGIIRRALRTPKRLSHVLYYVMAVGVFAVSAVADPSMLPTFLGAGSVLLGILLAGGAVCLNPLGEEGSMLEQLVLAEYAPNTFVRARLLAGIVIGIPFVLVGTALLSIDSLSPLEALLAGGFWLALVPASAAGALGIGTLLPKSDPGQVLEKIEARPPEKIAMAVHGLLIVVLAGVGGFLLVTDLDPWLRVGGLAAVAVSTVVFADGGYRFAVSAIDDYGQHRRPDSVYALELAIGLGLLGLTLSLTVTQGVLILAPVSGTPAFVLALLATFTGWAVAGVAYLLASGRSSAFLDIRVPTATDGRYLAAGLLASLGVNGAVVVAITSLDAPVVPHTIADEVAAGGPAFVLALIAIAILVNGPVEEFLFRNVIQKRLGEAFSARSAILAASVVFTLVHVPVYFTPDPVAVVISLAPLLVLSMIWGFLYERTGNLVVPALCHGLYNGVIFGVVYVSVL